MIMICELSGTWQYRLYHIWFVFASYLWISTIRITKHQGPIMSKRYNRSIAILKFVTSVTRVPIFTAFQCNTIPHCDHNRISVDLSNNAVYSYKITQFSFITSVFFLVMHRIVNTGTIISVAMESIPPVRSWHLLDLWHPGAQCEIV